MSNMKDYVNQLSVVIENIKAEQISAIDSMMSIREEDVSVQPEQIKDFFR